MGVGYKNEQEMKNRIILFAVISLLLTACGNEKENKVLDITGQWELIEIQTKSAQIGDAVIEVYIDFKKDNTFDLWQKLGEGRHEKLSGTWALSDNILSGKYDDKKDWGTSYDVSIESGNLIMVENKTGTEKCIYSKCTIPSFN